MRRLQVGKVTSSRNAAISASGGHGYSVLVRTRSTSMFPVGVERSSFESGATDVDRERDRAVHRGKPMAALTARRFGRLVARRA